MDYYSKQISQLIEELSKLPGVGNKSAQRLAFHIINRPVEEVERLANTILDARKNVRYCKECFTLTDQELCPICRNEKRDHTTIMVVETPEISRPMKRPENMRAFTMCFTAPFPPCWASAPTISA